MPSKTPTRYINIKPSQKFGMDIPVTAPIIAMISSAEPWWIAEKKPKPTPPITAKSIAQAASLKVTNKRSLMTSETFLSKRKEIPRRISGHHI
jgi:hypothetical protein